MDRFALIRIGVCLLFVCSGLFAGPVTETGSYSGTNTIYLRVITNHGGNPPGGPPHTGLSTLCPVPDNASDPLTFNVLWNPFSYDPFGGHTADLAHAWLVLGNSRISSTEPTFSHLSGVLTGFNPAVSLALTGGYLITSGAASVYYSEADAAAGLDLMANPTLAEAVRNNGFSVAFVQTFGYRLTNRTSHPSGFPDSVTYYQSANSGVAGSISGTLEYAAPEPTTMILVGAGLLGIGLLKRRN